MSISNTTILLFVLGYQGGTVHQLAEELGVPTEDILDADEERMGNLMRIAQKRQWARQDAAQKAKVKDEITYIQGALVDIADLQKTLVMEERDTAAAGKLSQLMSQVSAKLWRIIDRLNAKG